MKSFLTVFAILSVALAATSIWPKDMTAVEVQFGNLPNLADVYANHCEVITRAVEYVMATYKDDYPEFVDMLATPDMDISIFGDKVVPSIEHTADKCGISKLHMKYYNFVMDYILPVDNNAHRTGVAVAYVGKNDARLISSELTTLPFDIARDLYYVGRTDDINFVSAFGYYGYSHMESPTAALSRVIGFNKLSEVIRSATSGNIGTVGRFFDMIFSSGFDAQNIERLLKSKISSKYSVVHSSVSFAFVHDKIGSVYDAVDRAPVSTSEDVWAIVASTYPATADNESIDRSADNGIAYDAVHNILDLGRSKVDIGENAYKMFYRFPVRGEDTIVISQNAGPERMHHCFYKTNSYHEVSVCADTLPLFDAMYFSISMVILAIVTGLFVWGKIYANKWDKMMLGEEIPLMGAAENDLEATGSVDE